VRPLTFVLQTAVVTLGFLVVAAAVALLVSLPAGLTQTFRVPSSAMEPTIHCAEPAAGCEARSADRVLVCRWCFWLAGPKRNDIVAFHAPARARTACGVAGVLLKRIVGLPGERISERAGHLYADGKPLSDPYVAHRNRGSQSFGPVRIPAGEYYVVGDNRAASCDSRRFGPVARSALIGRLVATYWPPPRVSFR
jgi:signal peptidase I